jgi:hypothetical protein
MAVPRKASKQSMKQASNPARKIERIAVLGSSHVARVASDIRSGKIKHFNKDTNLGFRERQFRWFGHGGLTSRSLLYNKTFEGVCTGLKMYKPKVVVLVLGSNDTDHVSRPAIVDIVEGLRKVVSWLYDVIQVHRVVFVPLFRRRSGRRIGGMRFKYPGRGDYNTVHNIVNECMEYLISPPVIMARYLPVTNDCLLPREDVHLNSKTYGRLACIIAKSVKTVLRE